MKVQVGVQCDSTRLPRERWQRTFDPVCRTPSLTHILEDEWEFLRQTEEVLKLGYWGAPSGGGNSMNKDRAWPAQGELQGGG